MSKRIGLAGLLVLFSCTLAATPAQHVPGELLIKYRDGVNIEAVHQASKATPLAHAPGKRWQRLRLSPESSVEEAVEFYRQQPEVEYAEPNYLARKAETIPDDPDYLASKQWALTNIEDERTCIEAEQACIEAELAWDLTQGSRDIVVAVVDTGIVYSHGDLAANMWLNPGEIKNEEDSDGNGIIDDLHGVSIKDGVISGDPLDDDTADWHGTHVAGIIGAVGNNGVGISGVNWQVSLMGVKVLHCPIVDNTPDCENAGGTVSDIIEGIDYAITNNAHVLNLSFIITGYSNALADALQRADEAGVLVVSAAGNSVNNNDTTAFSPAAIRTPNNIAVAAINKSNELAAYSNYGLLSVDLAAPGGENSNFPTAIYSTVGPGDNYRYIAGTSMAAPHVAGVAALIRAHQPTLSHHQVKARILNSARSLPSLVGKTISGGTLDAYAALLANEETPAIFRIQPPAAYAGDELVITGSNFGLASGSVSAGEHAFPVPLEWTDKEIRVSLPGDLPLGQWHVRVNGQGSGFALQRLNRPPEVSLSVSPSSGQSPLSATLTATASDQDGEVVQYEWDLGDGSFSQNTAGESSLQHTFSGSGTLTLRVRATDNDGGSSITTATLALTVPQGESDSRCFIATAAYGSPMTNEVMALRHFRDRYLLTSAPGRQLVSGYYALSPVIADTIRQREWLRATVRSLLRPMVAMAGWLVGDAEASSGKPLTPPEQEAMKEYLLGFVVGTGPEQVEAIIHAEGGQLREYKSAIGLALATWPASQPAEALFSRLEAHPQIRYAEPNFIAGKP